jgi:hypothetical protein
MVPAHATVNHSDTKPVGALFGMGNRGPDRIDRMLQTAFKGQRGVVAFHRNKTIGYELAHG